MSFAQSCRVAHACLPLPRHRNGTGRALDFRDWIASDNLGSTRINDYEFVCLWHIGESHSHDGAGDRLQHSP